MANNKVKKQTKKQREKSLEAKRKKVLEGVLIKNKLRDESKGN